MAGLQQDNDRLKLAIAPETAMAISRGAAEAWKEALDKGLEKVVLLCDSRLRQSLAAMLARTVPPLPVIAYDEIVLNTDIESIKMIYDNSEHITQDKRRMIGAGV